MALTINTDCGRGGLDKFDWLVNVLKVNQDCLILLQEVEKPNSMLSIKFGQFKRESETVKTLEQFMDWFMNHLRDETGEEWGYQVGREGSEGSQDWKKKRTFKGHAQSLVVWCKKTWNAASTPAVEQDGVPTPLKPFLNARHAVQHVMVQGIVPEWDKAKHNVGIAGQAFSHVDDVLMATGGEAPKERIVCLSVHVEPADAGQQATDLRCIIVYGMKLSLELKCQVVIGGDWNMNIYQPDVRRTVEDAIESCRPLRYQDLADPVPFKDMKVDVWNDDTAIDWSD